MTASRSLPLRPSLDSLRKQAKQLVRGVANGDPASMTRMRAHLPAVQPPLTQRNAQLVIAREYGYAGWQDLVYEVKARLGRDLESAVARARRLIQENDVDGLKQLLVDYPALLSWRDEGSDGREGLLGFATGSYGDSFDPSSEEHFTRRTCAELLIDANAIVVPSVFDGLLSSRARGLLGLFERKGLVPRTLVFAAALGDETGVHTGLEEQGADFSSVSRAFAVACAFGHEAIAMHLLDRAIILDPGLGARIDEGPGRLAFTKYFIEHRPGYAETAGLWRAFVMEQVSRAVYSWSGSESSFKNRRGVSDLPAFAGLLKREPWLLGDAFVDFQIRIIERATLVGRGEFVTSLLDLEPAVLRRQPPPPSQAIEFACTYANTHVIPDLSRLWPVPDDLPHAAALGDLPRVERWFDASGAPALGNIHDHYPASPYMPVDRVAEYVQQWGPHNVQRILDVALAWAVINSHFDVADYLLTHGADVNTTWSSHEPASILHELVWHRNYAAMQFLIDRGIDMTIRDHRWNGTAEGWAEYAAGDLDLARWLNEAQRRRDAKPG